MESDWLKDLPGYKTVVDAIGNVLPERKTLKLIGTGFSVTDNPATGETELEFNSAGIVDWKSAARVVVTSALPAYTRLGNVITANANGALPSQDGVALALNDRLGLAIGTHADNGLWTVTDLGSAGTPFVLTRATDADSSAEVTAGMAFGVTEGTVSAGTFWILVTADPITLNTTPLTFTKLTGIGAGSSPDQILKWNGSSWLAGALNLAAAAAVTGVLAVANGGTGLAAIGAANTVAKVKSDGTVLEYGKLTTANLDASAGILGSQLSATAGIVGTQLSATAAIAATQLAAGAAGTVLIGGASNSFSAAPTVTSLAASSYLAAGGTVATAGALRLAHGASVQGRDVGNAADRVVASWGVVANDTVGLGDANVVTRITGSALHAYAGATQVAQLGLATTDFLKMGDVPAATGNLRVDDSWTLKQRNANPGTADRAVITCGGESLVIGDTLYTGLTQIKGSTTTIEAGASQAIIVYSTAGNSALVLDANGASFGLGIFRAQGAIDCNVRNASTGGASYSTRIQGYNGSAWTTGMRVQNVASGACTVHLGENGGNIALWDATGSFGSGVGVLFGKTRTTAPSTAPVGGGLLYFDASGNPWSVDTGGIHVQLN